MGSEPRLWYLALTPGFLTLDLFTRIGSNEVQHLGADGILGVHPGHVFDDGQGLFEHTSFQVKVGQSY